MNARALKSLMYILNRNVACFVIVFLLSWVSLIFWVSSLSFLIESRGKFVSRRTCSLTGFKLCSVYSPFSEKKKKKKILSVVLFFFSINLGNYHPIILRKLILLVLYPKQLLMKPEWKRLFKSLVCEPRRITYFLIQPFDQQET